MLLLLATASWGQQEATYAQYMFNGLAINPAYAGQHRALSVNVLSRFQNVGLPGAPTTQSLAVHSPLMNQRFAVGALFVHDKIGVISQTQFSGIYAYRIPVSLRGTLSFGIQAGLSRYAAQYSALDIYQSDPAFSQDINETRPNIGTGIFLDHTDWYVGLSAPHMLNNVFTRDSDLMTIHQPFPVILTGGVVFPISRAIHFKPNTLIKLVDGRLVEIDINANFLFDEVIWAGISYHSSQSLSFLVDLQVTDQLRLGYSYSAAFGEIKTVQIGSHEVFLGYVFKFNSKGIVSPRYF
ncbi:MAG: type IX secretion system membrane protein PorP/SprF [Cyclobacteriaceae bacterium]|nr:type IX secretion system membrane protein PorP/SprF [Cyclobacteriaceae bacterium]